MPDDTEKNQNLDNADYNPNRPPQEDHSSTKKVVDTAAKGAAEYFAPGVGGSLYDAAKSAPVVGDAVNKVTDTASEALDRVPGVKKVTKKLDDSGAVDAANKGIDMLNPASAGTSGAKNAVSGTKNAVASAPSVGQSAPKSATPSAPSAQTTPTSSPGGYRKNNDFNLGVEKQKEVDDAPDSSENKTNPIDNLTNKDKDSEQASDNNAEQNGSSDILESAVKSFIKRHIVSIILIGGGALFFFFLIFIITSGIDENNYSNQGYYDGACNFNDTTITINSCTSDTSIENISLEEYVKKMTSAYIEGKNYSEEAIKALMIIIKTNALSYGNYNSSSKSAEVSICDVYKDNTNNESDLWMFDSTKTTDLDSLYNTISEYIYVSSSYKSSISSLNENNALDLNDNILNSLNELGEEGKTYSVILSELYKSEEDESQVETTYRENLFLGDSRTQGMKIAGVVDDNNAVYGVGCGYNWLIGNGTYSSDKTNSTSGGIKGINSKIKDNTLYNIIIWLGVNDISLGANKYFEKYKELAAGEWKNHNLYIVSLGPVDDSKAKNVKNAQIDEFNRNMESLINSAGISNIFYINLNYTESSINSYDNAGLHYGAKDYKEIFNIITNNVDTKLSSKLSLYKLSEYCTYYDLTDNDKYWWPIGSKNATSGNIYGGTPVSITITSPFGQRIHPIRKTVSTHYGIDIGVSRRTPIIATKDGVVIKAVTGCTEGNYSCGNTYGNHIKIKHDEEISSQYAHLDELVVKEGDTVKQGQIIAYSGSTGSSTGPHLHFEIWLNGTRVNPEDYVDATKPRPGLIKYAGVGDGGDATENKMLVCNALLDSGYSKEAVAGMMVNIAAEGAFNTTNLENCYEENKCCTTRTGTRYGFCMHPEIKGFGSDAAYTSGVDSGAYSKNNFINDRAGYGLIQWTSSGRKKGLYEYAKGSQKSIGSLDIQLGYLLEEIKGYSVTYKYVTGNYSGYEIANNFCLDFERPANKETGCPARARDNIDRYLTFVNNGCKE